MSKILQYIRSKSIGEIDDNFETIDYTNEKVKFNGNTKVRTAEIKTKSQLLKVEDEILSGHILFVKLQLQAGLTTNYVLNYLQETVDQINGDIVLVNNEELIITPEGIPILRQKIR